MECEFCEKNNASIIVNVENKDLNLCNHCSAKLLEQLILHKSTQLVKNLAEKAYKNFLEKNKTKKKTSKKKVSKKVNQSEKTNQNDRNR